MLYIWRHFRLQVPDDWEMLFYAKPLQAGRCAFADRYQHRLEFSWSIVPSKPDFDRMISDYLAEVRRDERASEAAETEVAGWRGFSAQLGDVRTTRFGAYMPEERVLLECVFLWPKRRERTWSGGCWGASPTNPRTKACAAGAPSGWIAT